MEQQMEQQILQQEPENKTAGIVSLVLGILALCLFCVWVNYILGIVSIVFGIIQLSRHCGKGLAIAGIVLSAVSFVLTAVLYAALIFSFMEQPEYYQYEYRNYTQASDYIQAEEMY